MVLGRHTIPAVNEANIQILLSLFDFLSTIKKLGTDKFPPCNAPDFHKFPAPRYNTSPVQHTSLFQPTNADIGDNSEILLDSYLTSLGAIDDYLIYFNGDYTSSTSAGSGFVEFSIDPIYMLLQTAFAPADVTLAKDLATCPLSQLKCGTSDPSITDTFKRILANYVDIYVSMIPNDPDLVISGQDNAVLYIDSSDKTVNTAISNISSTKLSRMISVTCEYV